MVASTLRSDGRSVLLEKVSKAAVHYKNEPKGPKHCSGCSMWRAPESCTLVMGVIKPYGYCIEWDKK